MLLLVCCGRDKTLAIPPEPLPPPTVTTPESQRSLSVRQRQQPRLQPRLEALGCPWGSPVFLRIFKQEGELELWVKPGQEEGFVLFENYPIQRWSGGLGPKLREGDGQAPEGFYRISPAQLNPNSSYHLSFDLGFPNEFDRAHERTGSFLMVHGSNVSVGCFAMGDPAIEEIYSLVDAALRHGQGYVHVHCHPFRHDREDAEQLLRAGAEWKAFWQQLHTIWQAFEERRVPPEVLVNNGHYELKKAAD